jgi:hypothetical protein
MDPNGNANAQIIHQWNEKIRTRILAQVEKSFDLIMESIWSF